MTQPDTRPLPTTAMLDALLAKQKAAFIETQRELARIARQRIDGDATKARRVSEYKSRMETP